MVPSLTYTTSLRREGSVAGTAATPASANEVSGADVQPFRKVLKDAAKAKKAASRRSNGGSKASEDTVLREWELTVGIEVHAQLDTETKLFSDASTALSDEPNVNIALFDLAMPGSQPIFQKATLIPALRAAIAFGCDIQQTSRFDRKHYFYQDQPAGYQITQYYEPYARNGSIWLGPQDGIAQADGAGVRIGIKQIQMEQDTAKSVETPSGAHLLDFNRVSRPLIEIITRPEIHSPQSAAACVRKIQATLQAAGAATMGMEMGGLRADVNVSVRRRKSAPGTHQYDGISGLGQRTEIKNLSSFKAVEDAVRAEMLRQVAVLESGGTIEGETRRWTIGQTETRKLREKEGEVDYRYMPDPDLTPVVISEDLVREIQQRMPEMPDEQFTTLTEGAGHSLPAADAKALMELNGGERLEYYYDVLDAYKQLMAKDEASEDCKRRDGAICRTVANWVLHEVGGLLSRASAADPAVECSAARIPSAILAQIIHLQQRREITSVSAKQLLTMVFNGDDRPVSTIIEQEHMQHHPMTTEEYVALAQAVMHDNADTVQQIRQNGQYGKIGFLVGQVVRRGEKGRVEAQTASKILRELLDSSDTRSP
ncbi:hypothetical protein KEM52_000533 [Ascosphaera acerosa]|nr:hypothetical protein KEM52_000533 [Ascosphaera acerosa]